MLVGAGFFGKIYCHTAKMNGAVAVDLGSAFDVLAGLSTRPAHTSVDVKALSWLWQEPRGKANRLNEN